MESCSNIPIHSTHNCNENFFRQEGYREKIDRLKKNRYWPEMKLQKFLNVATGEEYTLEEIDTILNN